MDQLINKTTPIFDELCEAPQAHPILALVSLKHFGSRKILMLKFGSPGKKFENPGVHPCEVNAHFFRGPKYLYNTFDIFSRPLTTIVCTFHIPVNPAGWNPPHTRILCSYLWNWFVFTACNSMCVIDKLSQYGT